MMGDLDGDDGELDYVNLDDLFDTNSESNLFGDLAEDNALQGTNESVSMTVMDNLYPPEGVPKDQPTEATELNILSNQFISEPWKDSQNQNSRPPTNASKTGGKKHQTGKSNDVRRRRSKVKAPKNINLPDIRSEVSIRGPPNSETTHHEEIELLTDHQSKLFFPFIPMPDDISVRKFTKTFPLLEEIFRKSLSIQEDQIKPSAGLISDLKYLLNVLENQQRFVDGEFKKLNNWVKTNLGDVSLEIIDQTLIKSERQEYDSKKPLILSVSESINKRNAISSGICHVRIRCEGLNVDNTTPLLANRKQKELTPKVKRQVKTKEKEIFPKFTLNHLKNQSASLRGVETLALSRDITKPSELIDENFWTHQTKVEEATNLSNIPNFGKEISTRKSHRFKSLIREPKPKKLRRFKSITGQSSLNCIQTTGLFDKLTSLLVHEADKPLMVRKNLANETHDIVDISMLNLDERAYIRLRAAKLLPFKAMMENDLTLYSEIDCVIDDKISTLNGRMIEMNKSLSKLYTETSNFVLEMNQSKEATKRNAIIHKTYHQMVLKKKLPKK